MAKKQKKQSISARNGAGVLLICWAVGLFCCLFLRRITLPEPPSQGISGQESYHSSTRLYSGKHNSTFYGLRLEFPEGEPLFLEDGMTPELAEQVEALEPGTRICYLKEPDSGQLMALSTEDRELLPYEAYAAAGQRGAGEVTWFGTAFLVLGAVFLIPIGRELRLRRKDPHRKKR